MNIKELWSRKFSAYKAVVKKILSIGRPKYRNIITSTNRVEISKGNVGS
jgi:hypothetical protein